MDDNFFSFSYSMQLLHLHKVAASQCQVTVENTFWYAKVQELSRPTILAIHIIVVQGDSCLVGINKGSQVQHTTSMQIEPCDKVMLTRSPTAHTRTLCCDASGGPDHFLFLWKCVCLSASL